MPMNLILIDIGSMLSILCVHAMLMPRLYLWHVVLMLVRCLVAVLDSLSFNLVSCVCVEPLLRFERAIYETCLVLHVDASCQVASYI